MHNIFYIERVFDQKSGITAENTPWKAQNILLAFRDTEQNREHRLIAHMSTKAVERFDAKELKAGMHVEGSLSFDVRTYADKSYTSIQFYLD